MPSEHTALIIKDLTHRFPENGITACRNISLQVSKGEIMAFLGENGAGKSTLMFLLSGAYTPSEGEIRVPGGSSPRDRRNYAGMIHQKPILAANLTVEENIILEGERVFFNPRQIREEIRSVQEHYNLPLDISLKAGDLTAPQIQRAELIRALWKKKELIILDEPTASLSDSQAEELFILMNKLKEEGRTILFITHKIHEVFRTADRIAVLRKGELITVGSRNELKGSDISRLMIGEADFQTGILKATSPPGEVSGSPVLELRGVDVEELGTKRLKEISLSLYAGQIVGISGIRENGVAHLEDLLTGMIQPSRGQIFIHGKDRIPLTPFKLRRWTAAYFPVRTEAGTDGRQLQEEDSHLGGRLYTQTRYCRQA